MRITKPIQRHALLAVLMIALYFTLIGAAPAAQFPDVIPLPNGFQPEGIASGKGTTFFVGSIPTGAVYRGDLKSGQTEELVPAQAGRSSIGMKYDARSGLLFVAGGATGKAYVYDGKNGATVAEIQLSTESSFINDVIITRQAAYFTNSFQAVIHKVPLAKNGKPLNQPSVTIPLSGEYEFTAGAFNANGIEASHDGKTLIIVNSSEGALYTVDPASGVAEHIDLGADSVPNGDGILLRGKTLYVVQNVLNQIAVVHLSPKFASGEVVDLITSPLFRVPTTIARFGDALYAVNARFDTPPTPDTEYEVVRVPKR